MTTFTVHEPPGLAASLEERAESLVFRARRVLVGCVDLWALLLSLETGVGGSRCVRRGGTLDARSAFALRRGGNRRRIGSLVLAFVAGFEANEIQRAWLSLQGWREIAVVSGRSLVECEHRFFTAWLPSEPHHTPTLGALLRSRGKDGWPRLHALRSTAVPGQGQPHPGAHRLSPKT